MKDNFSDRSDLYAKFRPGYPDTLFDFVRALSSAHKNAWDCGTGNGQVATRLSDFFERVHASDISENQLKLAEKKSNIIYSLQPAERTVFPGQFFDLITVAQAIHWFNFKSFYREVKRVGKPKSHLVVTGYGNLRTTEEIDRVINRLYKEITGNYWDSERRYIDESYLSIPFPFKEIAVPALSNTYMWSLEQVKGYLSTWSGVKHYQKQTGIDPVELISDDLSKAWGNAKSVEVDFPVLLRVGRIH